MAVEYGLSRGSARQLDNVMRSSVTVTQAMLRDGRCVDTSFRLITENGPAALSSTDKQRKGIALTSDNCVYITNIEPSTKRFESGLCCRVDGVVWVTITPVLPVRSIFNTLLGFVMIDAAGALYVGDGGFNPLLPDFYAPFADAGAGVATLTLTTGSGSATYTRTSAASTVLSTGLIGNVSSGDPRSRYDPASLTYQGYYGETSSINICLQSEDFGTTWAAIGTPTRSAGAATCGVVSLDLIGDDSAVALEGYTQTISFTGNAVKAISFFFKQGTSTSTEIRLLDSTAVANRLLCAITWSGATPSITMTTGTLIQIAGPFGASGVYRAELLTTSVTATNTNALEIYPASDAALAVLGTGDINIGGVQAENTIALCSSYTKTTTGTVARSGDVLSYTSANLSASIGTASCSISFTNSANVAARSALDGGSNSTGLLLGLASPDALTEISMDDGVAGDVTKSGLTSILNTPRKRASAWGGVTMSITGDGATVATGAFDGAMTATSLRITVGQSATGTMIKEAKVWFTQASDQQLQDLTA